MSALNRKKEISMQNYYIEEIKISGPNRRDSSVTFSEGLNIISGPSNTGKTSIVKAIDFLYGAKKENAPFSIDDTGYDKVEMIINSHLGRFSLERRFDENKIIVNEVTISGEKSLHKEYNARNGNNVISHFWLSLIGIDDTLKIIKNESFVRQSIGWRTFSPSTLISQSRVDSETSVLLPDIRQQTAFLSCLLYLLYGDDFSDSDEKETKEQRKIRRKSVSNYINESLSDLYEQYEQAKSTLSVTQPLDLKQSLSEMFAELEIVENEISLALTDSKAVAKEIYKYEQQLQEENLLTNRYQMLQSQYKSDIERLTLIVDGERLINAHNEHLSSHNCPFCNGELGETEQTNYIEASRAELQTLISQLADLSEANKETKDEIIMLSTKLETLQTRKADISNKINAELKPKANTLKEKISDIESFIEINQQLNSMKTMQSKFKADLEAIENEAEDKSPKYKPKERFEANFYAEMSTILDQMLSQMSYKPTEYRNAFFAKIDFDIRAPLKTSSSC